MHIPIQVDYGVRALVDLAEHGGGESIRATEIAKRRGIPEPFLQRVLHTLTKHGVTRSSRGPLGGHALAKDPSQISMGMVMDYLGGNQTLVNCLTDVHNCGQSPSCSQMEIWRTVEEAVQTILDSTSIADLVDRIRTAEADEESRRPKATAVA